MKYNDFLDLLKKSQDKVLIVYKAINLKFNHF